MGFPLTSNISKQYTNKGKKKNEQKQIIRFSVEKKEENN